MAEAPIKPESPIDPGETFVHPLDVLEQQAAPEMEALEKTAKGEAPETPPPEPPPAPETPPVETPPVDAPETPPVEVPPVEAAPETAPPAAEPEKEKRKPRPGFWSQMREAEKRNKEERDRLAKEREDLEAEKRRLAGVVDPDVEIDDPLTKMGKELEDLKKRDEVRGKQVEQLHQTTAAEREAERQRLAILDEVRDFEKAKPDYTQALEYLVTSRREELDDMGMIDAAAEKWLLQAPDVVKRAAAEIGMATETEDQLYEAAREIGFRVIIENERNLLVQGARTRAEKIPEVVYRAAVRRGYKSEAAAAPAAPVVSPEAQAKERVQAAMRSQAATQSLSAVGNGGAPKGREIKTREDVLALTDVEIAKLDLEQPGWDRAIFGG